MHSEIVYYSKNGILISDQRISLKNCTVRPSAVTKVDLHTYESEYKVPIGPFTVISVVIIIYNIYLWVVLYLLSFIAQKVFKKRSFCIELRDGQHYLTVFESKSKQQAKELYIAINKAMYLDMV